MPGLWSAALPRRDGVAGGGGCSGATIRNGKPKRSLLFAFGMRKNSAYSAQQSGWNPSFSTKSCSIRKRGYAVKYCIWLIFSAGFAETLERR
jgi:hypothetical protein